MWYDVNKTLTHNALINMVIGPRGFGKTYALKKRALKNFLDRKEQFIYLRRYQAELDLVKENLFGDLYTTGAFGRPIDLKGEEYTIEGQTAGYAIALSRANYYKSASFPMVSLIIFDEFIIDTKSSMRYLKNEVRKFLDFYETIARMRENVKVFMLANSLSIVNPYTLFWFSKIDTDSGRIFKAADNLVLLELVGDEEFKEAKRKTKFGRLIQGTEFEAMSVDNQFILDNKTFVEKRPGTSRYMFTMVYMGVRYAVWWDTNSGLYYMDQTVDPSCILCFSVTLDDHSPNMMLIKSNKGAFHTLVKAFKMGCVRFDTIGTKQAMMEIFKMTLAL